MLTFISAKLNSKEKKMLIFQQWIHYVLIWLGSCLKLVSESMLVEWTFPSYTAHLISLSWKAFVMCYCFCEPIKTLSFWPPVKWLSNCMSCTCFQSPKQEAIIINILLAEKFLKQKNATHFNVLQVCPSVPPFLIVVLYTFFLFVFFFFRFGGSSHCSNFDAFF